MNAREAVALVEASREGAARAAREEIERIDGLIRAAATVGRRSVLVDVDESGLEGVRAIVLDHYRLQRFSVGVSRPGDTDRGVSINW